MSETRPTTQSTAERHRNLLFKAFPKRPAPVGEMTYLVLITIAAAILTGFLVLPITMSGGSFADLATGTGAGGAGIPLSVRTSPV